MSNKIISNSIKPSKLMPHDPVDCPLCYNATQDIQKKCNLCNGKTLCTYREAIDAIEAEQVQQWTAEHFEGLKRAISLMMLDPYRVAMLFKDENDVSHAAYNLFASYDVDKDALKDISNDNSQFKESLKSQHWCSANIKEKKLDNLLWQRTHRPEWGNEKL